MIKIPITRTWGLAYCAAAYILVGGSFVAEIVGRHELSAFLELCFIAEIVLFMVHWWGFDYPGQKEG